MEKIISLIEKLCKKKRNLAFIIVVASNTLAKGDSLSFDFVVVLCKSEWTRREENYGGGFNFFN